VVSVPVVVQIDAIAVGVELDGLPVTAHRRRLELAAGRLGRGREENGRLSAERAVSRQSERPGVFFDRRGLDPPIRLVLAG
jgi:hypothetical protein